MVDELLVPPTTPPAGDPAAPTNGAGGTPLVTPPVLDPAAPVTPPAPVVAAAVVVPEKYELKLPDGSTFQPDFVTRTADTARALGLSNEAGQKLLDAQIAEVSKATTVAVDAAKAEQLEAMQPGGAIWTEHQTQWQTKALADAEIGGSPEKLQANVDLALKVVNKFATADTKKFFQDTGLGSHPELVRIFARIGKQMSEASLVMPGASGSLATTEEQRLAKRYPTMAPKP